MCLHGCGPRITQVSLWRDERTVSAVFYCAEGISFALREPYDYALPYLRFGIGVIALFLGARLLLGLTLKAAAAAARVPTIPYQRGQFWVRRFRRQAENLSAALAALIAPPAALNFTSKALQMLESIGWIASHRFLFAGLRVHLLGWPAFLAPDGRIAALPPVAPSA